MSPRPLEPRKLLLVADTDGNWYVRRVKWTIDDAKRDLMIYECDEPIGAAFEFAEQGLSALRRALREQNGSSAAEKRRSATEKPPSPGARKRGTRARTKKASR